VHSIAAFAGHERRQQLQECDGQPHQRSSISQDLAAPLQLAACTSCGIVDVHHAIGHQRSTMPRKLSRFTPSIRTALVTSGMLAVRSARQSGRRGGRRTLSKSHRTRAMPT
jgi:hypothetical protein